MIIVTGGAGFIGSAVVWYLNRQGIDDIIIVDNLGTSSKWRNLVTRRYVDYVHKESFLEQVRNNAVDYSVDAVIHMGACSSTTERNADYLMENNYRYSTILARWAVDRGIRFIYASSAATYGDGSRGFSDDDAVTETLEPINMYGYSKQMFDLWVLRNNLQETCAGLKFFNVYGPNEYHKGDMRSVVHKAVQEIEKTGEMRLFRSYRREYGDGEQRRDFVYVKDCVSIIGQLLNNKDRNGIFNVGTGRARTWNDLVSAVCRAMNRETIIRYIDMPEEIREQYQYHTEAATDKLQTAGLAGVHYSLEEGIEDYVKSYLMGEERCLER